MIHIDYLLSSRKHFIVSYDNHSKVLNFLSQEPKLHYSRWNTACWHANRKYTCFCAIFLFIVRHSVSHIWGISMQYVDVTSLSYCGVDALLAIIYSLFISQYLWSTVKRLPVIKYGTLRTQIICRIFCSIKKVRLTNFIQCNNMRETYILWIQEPLSSTVALGM